MASSPLWRCGFAVLCISLFVASHGFAKPHPIRGQGALKTDELAFNHGESARLTLAELSVFSRRSDAQVFELAGDNWLLTGRSGELIQLETLSDRYPSQRLGELLDVYRVDLNLDKAPEYFVFVRGKNEDGRQYSATVLTERNGKLSFLYRPQDVPGERFRMVDVRDHDGDGRPEIILAGEGGEGDFYTYFAVLAMNAKGELQQRVLQAPETVHLMDMDEDGTNEFLVRKVVSKRGERPLYWTLVDRIMMWNGQTFEEEPKKFLDYHNEETKPRLIDELLDFHQEDLLLLETKVEVIRQVHSHVVATTPISVKRDSSVVFARVALEKGRKKRARALLERAIKEDPFRVDALYELAKLEMWAAREREAIALLYRAIGVKPQSGPLWMTLGLCFSRIGEADTAMAAMCNSVRLSEEPQARLGKLERLAETYRMKQVREHIGQALEVVRELVTKDEREMDEVEGTP